MATILLQIEADPSGLAPAAESIKQIGKLTDDLYQKLVDAGDGFKQMAAAAKASATDAAAAQGKLNQSISQFSSSMQSITKTVSVSVFKQVSTEVTEFAASVDGAVTSIQSLQTQQTEIVTVMEEMVTMSQETTQAYAELEVALENNKQAIEESAGALADMDWDTSIMEDTYSMLEYLSEGFKNVDGIAQEFGINSEELQQIISGLEITMAAVNQIMAAQSVIQKANAAATAFANAQLKAQEIFMKMNAVATTIATGIFNLFGVSVNVTSNAFKILKAAIVSTGIGALVVGIGAVVAGIMAWSDANEDNAKTEQDRAQALQNTLDAMERENKLLEEQNNRAIDAAEAQLKLAKAKGDKKGEEEAEELVFKVNKQAIEKEMAQLKQDLKTLAPEGIDIPAEMNPEQIDAAITDINAQLADLQQQKIDVGDDEDLQKELDNKIKKFEAFSKKLYDLSGKNSDMNKVVNDKAADDIADTKRDKEEDAKNKKKAADDNKKYLKQKLDDLENFYEQSLIGVTKGSAQELDITQKYLENKKLFYQKHYKALEIPASEFNLKIAKLDDELKNLGKKSREEQLKDLQDINNLAIAMAEDGSKAQLDAKIKYLEDENKFIKDNYAAQGTLSTENLLKIKANEDAVKDLKFNALEESKRIAIIEKDLLDAGYKDKAALQADYNNFVAQGNQISYEAYLKLEQSKSNAEDELLKKSNKSREDLRKDYANAVAGGYLKDYTTFLAAEQAKLNATQKRLDTEKAWIDTSLIDQQQINDDYQAWLKDHRNADYEDFVEFEQKKIDELKKKADEKKELDKALSDAGLELASEAASTLMDIANTNRQASFDSQMNTLQKEKEAELATKNLTEKQKEAINKKYADKEKALKRQKFEADKQAKIGEAIINAALGVTKLVATSPPPDPRFFIGLGMIAATTGLQIAKIASQPVPQFAKGTRNAPPGFKWVGEQGPELINTPGGHAIITAPESAQLSAIFDKYGLPGLQVPQFKAASLSNMLSYQSDNTSAAAIDYDEMGRSIARHLPEGTKVNINMDKDGVHAYVTRSNSRVNYNNNKFRFN